MKKKVFDSKVIKYLLCILSSILLITACTKNNNNDIVNEIDNIDTFSNNIKDLMDAIKNNKHTDIELEYYYYRIDNGYIYDFFDFEYDISNYDIDNGLVFENSNHDIYISLENKNYCVIKELEQEQYKVYEIEEKDKCHKLYTIDGNILTLDITAMNLEANEQYIFGQLSSGYITLSVNSNLIDSKAVDYTWYRNGIKIEASNVETYVITADYEDADYYVELTNFDNEIVAQSEPVNVKINRK